MASLTEAKPSSAPQLLAVPGEPLGESASVPGGLGIELFNIAISHSGLRSLSREQQLEILSQPEPIWPGRLGQRLLGSVGEHVSAAVGSSWVLSLWFPSSSHA